MRQLSYGKFNGTKEEKFTVEEGEGIVTVDVETTSGSLGMTITDSEGNSYYNGTELPTSTFEVTLNGAGKYTVRVDAADHVGGFQLSFS